MRLLILCGLLTLGGCASPEAAFPALGGLVRPGPAPTGAAAWAAAEAAIAADGAAARAAGERLRAGGT
ncbi:MAG: hypothetical protein U1F24_13900 [Alphaproteobacteria bacterium]